MAETSLRRPRPQTRELVNSFRPCLLPRRVLYREPATSPPTPLHVVDNMPLLKVSSAPSAAAEAEFTVDPRWRYRHAVGASCSGTDSAASSRCRKSKAVVPQA